MSLHGDDIGSHFTLSFFFFSLYFYPSLLLSLPPTISLSLSFNRICASEVWRRKIRVSARRLLNLFSFTRHRVWAFHSTVRQISSPPRAPPSALDARGARSLV